MWICVSSRNAGGREPEAFHRPVEIGFPIAPAQRQPFADRRLVDLDDADAGGFQVRDLVAQRERDLAADLGLAAGHRARRTIAAWSPDRSACPSWAASSAIERSVDHSTVIGFGRDTSPKMIGGRT